jgi:hypothetical protein
VGRRGTKHLIEVDTDDSSADGTLVATAQHPVLTGTRGWVDAQHLRAGDTLAGPGNVRHRVVRVYDRGWVTHQLVYNLTVGDLHTYTVWTGDAAVTVHNVFTCSKTFKTWRAAKAAAKRTAQRLRRKGQRAEYRGPCRSGDRYHCDVYDRRGNLQTTMHFRRRDKSIRRWW